jgi:hypothetical protein
MSRIRAFITVRFLVAALIVLFGAALYIASIPKSDAGGTLVCTYYSDATYTHAVGGRGTGCCGASLNWGVISAFKKCQSLVCTQQICPN